MARIRTGTLPDAWEDIGRAAAAVDGIAALGRLSIELGDVPAGAGPVERRRLSPDELAARLGREPEPYLRPRPAPVTREHQHPVTRPQEQPMTVTPTSPSPPLPCVSCLKADVCGIRPELAEAWQRFAGQVVAEVREGVRLQVADLAAQCDFYAPSKPAGVRVGVRLAAARVPKERAQRRDEPSKRRQMEARADEGRRVLEVVERHGGDIRAAAQELGRRANAVAMIVKHARLREQAAATAGAPAEVSP